jgi:hypothetical protein
MLGAIDWNEWVAIGTLTLAAVTVVLAFVSAAGVIVARDAARDTRRLAETAEQEARAVLEQAEATRSQAAIAQATLSASVQPLLGHVPLGEFDEDNPEAEIGAVKVKGDNRHLWISIPVRNVGSGVAVIQEAKLAPGSRVRFGQGISSTMVPVGELTRCWFAIDRRSNSDLIETLDQGGLWLQVFYTGAAGGQSYRTEALVEEASHNTFEVTRVRLYRGEEDELFASTDPEDAF